MPRRKFLPVCGSTRDGTCGRGTGRHRILRKGKGKMMSESLPSQPQSAVEAVPGTSGLAVTSLILGVLSWIGMPLLGGIAAVIAGHVARNDIRKAAGRVGGDGMALAGIVLGYANIALGVLIGLCIVGIVVISLLSAMYS
jgi:hypothetical protein